MERFDHFPRVIVRVFVCICICVCAFVRVCECVHSFVWVSVDGRAESVRDAEGRQCGGVQGIERESERSKGERYVPVLSFEVPGSLSDSVFLTYSVVQVDLFITNSGGHNPSYIYRLLAEYYRWSLLDAYILSMS